jgi:hypothetical protein
MLGAVLLKRRGMRAAQRVELALERDRAALQPVAPPVALDLAPLQRRDLRARRGGVRQRVVACPVTPRALLRRSERRALRLLCKT